jgi:hypothetical protein
MYFSSKIGRVSVVQGNQVGSVPAAQCQRGRSQRCNTAVHVQCVRGGHNSTCPAERLQFRCRRATLAY